MFYCLKTSIKEKYTKMLLPLSSFKHRRKGKQRNSMLFLSSSEWNLYRFTKFTEIHKLPKAVLLKILKQV
jgi:hypothetical protein